MLRAILQFRRMVADEVANPNPGLRVCDRQFFTNQRVAFDETIPRPPMSCLLIRSIQPNGRMVGIGHGLNFRVNDMDPAMKYYVLRRVLNAMLTVGSAIFAVGPVLRPQSPPADCPGGGLQLQPQLDQDHSHDPCDCVNNILLEGPEGVVYSTWEKRETCRCTVAWSVLSRA